MPSWSTGLHRSPTESGLPPAPGLFLTVDGDRVHAMFDGSADADVAVVFESALGCPCTEWAHVQRELAAEGVRSVAYDRPGIGWSPETPQPSHSREHADRLFSLVRQLTPQNVVLAGHSVGGLLSLLFWQAHPERVAALLLVDSSHPEQHVRSSRQREGLRGLRQQLHRARRRRRPVPFDGDVVHLPTPLGRLTHSAATSHTGTRASLREFEAWQALWAPDAAHVVSLEDLPLTVITAGDVVHRDPAHGVLQRELAALSRNARHVVIDDATHQGLVMRPEHAARVASEIINLVRKG